MSQTIHDLLVVGGGLAGLTAAARASELGLRPIVLEQGADDDYPCNSRYAGGMLHVTYQDVRLPPAQLAQVVREAMGADADESLIAAVTARAAPALDWITALGTRFIKGGPLDWHRWTLAPPRPLRPGLSFPGTGPGRLLAALTATLERHGGAVLRGHRAVTIARADGTFRVGAETAQGVRDFVARAVVLADGGFQGDAELVRQYVSPSPERMVQRGAGTGRGTAVRFARALGCGLSRMDRFYGHLLARDALTNPELWPYPQIDPVAAAGIVVDARGRRFVDEARGGVFISNAAAKLADPAGIFAIVDESIWEGPPGRDSLYPSNPHLVNAGGVLHRADDVRGLARQAGIDPDGLERTIAAYNDAARAGAPGLRALDVPRTGTPAPIAAAPLYAIPMTVGITNTMGGIRVDADARALDEQGRPIPGLYAAGAAAGGLEGGERVGYVGGLMRGLTSGMAAAEHAAASARRAVDGHAAARDPGAADAVGASSAPGAPQSTQGLPAPVAARTPSAVPTSPPRGPSRPPVLGLLARHGTPVSVVAGLLAAIAAGALTSASGAWLSALVALLVGGGVFVLIKAIGELARIIIDTLLPG